MITKKRVNAKEQKELLAKVLNECYGKENVICKQNGNKEVDFEWGNIKESTKTEYSEIYNALCDYRGYTEFAKPGKIKCDYFISSGDKIIIEYDEEQHFTKARSITFEHYPNNFKIRFDKDKWKELCEQLDRHDNVPAYRDEQRAFRDAIRDIEADKNKYKLFRIYNGQYDFNDEKDLAAFWYDLKVAICK
jgi:hypothetical protein